MGTSSTPNSLVASGWRAKRAREWLSGLEIVNAPHMEFCWIYKRHINKQKQFKKCLCDSVAFNIPSYMLYSDCCTTESCPSFSTLPLWSRLSSWICPCVLDVFLSFLQSIVVGHAPGEGAWFLAVADGFVVKLMLTLYFKGTPVSDPARS